MQSPRVIRKMLTDLLKGGEGAKELPEILDLLGTAAEAMGPRVAWATWIPDAGPIMGGTFPGMMAGGEEMAAGMPMIPEILLVAEVRDGKAFERLVRGVTEKMNVPVRRTEGPDGTKRMMCAGGLVELIQGEGWMALGLPPERAREAADRAGGTTGESLWAEPGYQGVVRRLPVDAMMVEYVSAQSVRQLLSLVSLWVPEAQFPPPSDEPLGVAMGVRVEEVQGRKMATAYCTADLDTLTYLVDAPLALQAVMLKPTLERKREEAESAVCEANLRMLGMAMQLYVEDHGGRFPEADRWVEELTPAYLANTSVFKCPNDGSEGRCSYGMNRELSGKSVDEIGDPASVVMLYETANPGDNPSGGTEDVVSPRHLGGTNYVFADGRVDRFGEAPRFGGE